MDTFRLLCVVLSVLISLLPSLDAQDCAKAIEELVWCADHGAALIQCDLDHTVNIISAKAYKSNVPSYAGQCVDKHEEGTYCEVDDVTCDVRLACSLGDPENTAEKVFNGNLDPIYECSYSYLNLAEKLEANGGCGNQFSSIAYTVVKYSCDPVFKADPNASKAVAMPMGTLKSFEAPLVHIDSHQNWVTKRITDEDKKCCVQVPADTDFLVYPYLLHKNLNGGGGCDQRLEISEGTDTKSFCTSSSAVQNYGCEPYPRAFEVRYVTTDPTVDVAFVFSLQVSSGVDLRVECGLPADDPCVPPTTTADPLASTASVDTTADTDTTPYAVVSTVSVTSTPPEYRDPTTEGVIPPNGTDEPYGGDTDLLPIIIGCALAALLILIIIAILVCTRTRGAAPAKEEMMYVNVMAEQDDSQIAFAPAMYMDGESLSSLTVQRQQDPINPMYGLSYADPGSTMQVMPANGNYANTFYG